MTSATSRDVKTGIMGASELPVPPGLPLGLGAAVQAATSSIVSPRGAAKRKMTAGFNPGFMSGLSPAASMSGSVSPPSSSNAPGENLICGYTFISLQESVYLSRYPSVCASKFSLGTV